MFIILLVVQTVGFEFLSVDPVARRLQGGIGITGDGYELNYNPAALAFNERQISTISYFNYIGGTHFGQVGHKIKQFGVMAKYFNGGSLKHTDNMGNELQPATFGVNFIDLTVGAGFKFHSKFGLGADLKFQYERIDTFTALGMGMDAGAYYQVSERIKTGSILKNLGYGIKPFIKEHEMLPFEFGIGGVIDWPKSSLFIDGYLPVVGKPNGRIGYEYWLVNQFSLKIGYNSKLLEVKTGEGAIDLIAGMNGGFGVKVGNFIFDYLITPYGELGLTHRLSLSFTHSK